MHLQTVLKTLLLVGITTALADDCNWCGDDTSALAAGCKAFCTDNYTGVEITNACDHACDDYIKKHGCKNVSRRSPLEARRLNARMSPAITKSGSDFESDDAAAPLVHDDDSTMLELPEDLEADVEDASLEGRAGGLVRRDYYGCVRGCGAFNTGGNRCPGALGPALAVTT